LLPALQRTRNQARAVVCQANLRQWGSVIVIYAEENDGHLPRRSDYSFGVWFLLGSVASTEDPNKQESLHQIDTKRIAICPMAKKSGTDHWSWTTNGVLTYKALWGSTFRAWELMYPKQFRGSFGLNYWLFNKSFDIIPVPFGFGRDDTEIFSLREKAKIPVLLDCTRSEGFRGPETYPEPPRKHSIFGLGLAPFCINRHNEYINGLFLDWSVRKVGLKELWTLKWHKKFDTANIWTKAGGVQPEDWPEWMRHFKDY